ncbi:hypothetical protein BX600DRAFT_434778 [Xylariales sp. PMI_506]|nr:hypothetical protein BX600DRAFT_434778 [Xylariales sp. PMI_506]
MSLERARGKLTKILVINPNSSTAMTEGVKTVINSLDLPLSTEIHTYTAPAATSPASINDQKDIWVSLAAVKGDEQGLGPRLRSGEYDGVLVACYSVHPLVPYLQEALGRSAAVTGIFEASIPAALSLLRAGERWGIVTTGPFWEEHLASGVSAFLGLEEAEAEAGAGTGAGAGVRGDGRFVGVESTGLNASDFHGEGEGAAELMRKKLKDATARLLRKGGDGASGSVSCVVMGCAGMAGLEDIIREAAAEEMGEDFAYGQLHVVDGVRAGIVQVDQMIKSYRLRPR